MKITIKELQEKQPSLAKILDKDMPFKLSYRLNKIASKIKGEMKHIQNTRIEMIKKFGEKDEKGNYEVKKNKIEAFADAWDEFAKTEITLNIEKIPVECMEQVELSGNDIASIIDFIEDPKQKKKKKK